MGNKRAFLKENWERTGFKMDKRGFELGISTLILLILAVLLLAGLIFFMTTGFGDFGDKIKVYLSYSNVDHVVNSCNILVDSNMLYRYCCEKNKLRYYVNGSKVSGDFSCKELLNKDFINNLKEMSCDGQSC